MYGKGCFFLAVDIHKLYRNVRVLAKHRNVPINILEENLGVELGYFARAENKELVPPVGTTAKIAEILKCPADMLLYADIAQFMDSDFYIHDFMQKLCEKTQDNALVWSKTEAGAYSAQILPDKDVYLSGALSNGSLGQLKIWMEDCETTADSGNTNAPAPPDDTGATTPSDSETPVAVQDAGADTSTVISDDTAASDTSFDVISEDDASKDAASEEKPKKKEYVVYDARKSYRDTYIHKHAKDTAHIVKAIADQPVDQKTLALMKQFLAEENTKSTEENIIA